MAYVEISWAQTVFEIVCVAVLPLMVVVDLIIQRLVINHSQAETVLLLEELVVAVVNKHDHDFDD